tara:strand:- start:1018 stop:2013 length:996 start_codon:yes stop_codon:yes gene_type:complete
MPNSYKEYTQGLTGNSFTGFDIKFISEGHLKVLTSTDDGSTFSTTSLTVTVSSNTATLSGAPSTGSDGINKIRIYRDTGTDQLVDFQNGSRLAESDLDSAYQQGLFAAQEVIENAPFTGYPATGAAGVSISSVTSSANAGVNTINFIGSDGVTKGSVTVNDGTNGQNGQNGTNASIKVATLKDENTSATGGGTFTTDAWQTRTLNTEVDPDNIVTLSNNQFTLAAGSYHITWSCPAYRVNTHQAKLKNITDTINYYGEMAYAYNNSAATQTVSAGSAVLTITGSKVFEIQHQSESTRDNSGFGIGVLTSFDAETGDSLKNVYSQVTITQLS